MKIAPCRYIRHRDPGMKDWAVSRTVSQLPGPWRLNNRKWVWYAWRDWQLMQIWVLWVIDKLWETKGVLEHVKTFLEIEKNVLHGIASKLCGRIKYGAYRHKLTGSFFDASHVLSSPPMTRTQQGLLSAVTTETEYISGLRNLYCLVVFWRKEGGQCKNEIHFPRGALVWQGESEHGVFLLHDPLSVAGNCACNNLTHMEAQLEVCGVHRVWDLGQHVPKRKYSVAAHSWLDKSEDGERPCLTTS